MVDIRLVVRKVDVNLIASLNLLLAIINENSWRSSWSGHQVDNLIVIFDFTLLHGFQLERLYGIIKTGLKKLLVLLLI